MTEQIPTNAVLNDMDDDALKALAAKHGVTDTDRADIIKELKLVRNAAKAGGAPESDIQKDPAQNDGHAQGGAGMNTAGQGTDQPGGAGVSDGPSTLGTGAADEGALAGHGAGPGAEPQDGARVPAQKRPEVGDAVFLFERNHDPVTSEALDGYQDPKVGTLVRLDEESGVGDIKVGGEESAPVTSHNVPHKHMAVVGDNYWSETAD